MDYKDLIRNKNSEGLHFWFRAKKNLIFNLCSRVYDKNKADRAILDIGCGTGTEVEVLQKFGKVTALDKNLEALRFARRTGCDTLAADIEKFKLPKDEYDCVGCFDILEHLEEDQRVLGNIHSSLNAAGVFIFTVPAYPALYGPHDIALEHKRRYSKKEIKKKLVLAGFSDIEIGYWNSFLFPLEAVFRLFKIMIHRLSPQKSLRSEAKPPTQPLNSLLFYILNYENRMVLKNKTLPFGLSIYGVAKK